MMIATEIGTVKKEDSGEIGLQIHKEFWEATINVEHFSHLIVLWWITENDTPEIRTGHLASVPRGTNAEHSGVFCTRSPRRPTPIGHTIVKLLEKNDESHMLIIDHMDAFAGTPIIDIKPYLPSSDRVDNAKVAPWFNDLKKRYTHK